MAAAEDVTQECFLILLKGSGFDSGQGSLRTYLFGIVRHLAIKRLRLVEREAEVIADKPSLVNPLGGLLERERASLVEQAVGQLPLLQKEALILVEYEELSLEDIACITGADVGAVKARLSRARESLRPNDRKQWRNFPEHGPRACSDFTSALNAIGVLRRGSPV